MNQILIIVGAAAVFFGAMSLRGIFGYLKNRKISIDDLHFSWRKFFGGAATPVALTVSIGGLAALILAFLKLVGVSGLKVAGIDQISLANLEIGLFIADIGAIGYAMKEGLMAFGLSDKQIEQIRSTVDSKKEGEKTGVKIGLKDGDLVAVADNITPSHLLKDEQTDDNAKPSGEDIEHGQGASGSPLDRRLPDGKWFGQCSRYSWYLATGIAMNYAPHPDYGPCNGNEMVDYLINKLGWKRCGKINGAIFSYSTSTYGHTGMVVDAANNIVNDCNWQPLRISTHPLNLDAVGAIYACPAHMIDAPKPTQPAPSIDKKPVDDNVVSAVLRGDYGNGDDRKARLEAAGYDYGAVQNAVNSRAPAQPQPETNTPRIGDHVKTSSAVDQNGVSLDLAIINDGGSIWTENNDRGMAVLRVADGTVRCAVPAESLSKA